MMSRYEITKTLNNNVIICTSDNHEVVLIGKGIGFNKKVGMTLDDSASIEKVYKLEQKQQKEHYQTLVEMGEDHVVQAVIESVNIISDAGIRTDDKSLVVALTDHIIFAYKRLKQNQVISNPFAIETQHLYSDAYQIAKQVINNLNQTLDVHFPEDEIGFIALHIASNSEDLSMHDISVINKLISKIMTIIETDLNHEIDKTTIQYQRFIRHIQFLIYRLTKGENVAAQDNFISMVKQLYPQCFNTAYKILKMIQRQFDVIIDESEIVYLALHIYHFEAQINIKR
ncbi:transcriptional antiterminator [Staphylococcus caprae]